MSPARNRKSSSIRRGRYVQKQARVIGSTLIHRLVTRYTTPTDYLCYTDTALLRIVLPSPVSTRALAPTVIAGYRIYLGRLIGAQLFRNIPNIAQTLSRYSYNVVLASGSQASRNNEAELFLFICLCIFVYMFKCVCVCVCENTFLFFIYMVAFPTDNCLINIIHVTVIICVFEGFMKQLCLYVDFTTERYMLIHTYYIFLVTFIITVYHSCDDHRNV